jgi:hypothetical protein
MMDSKHTTWICLGYKSVYQRKMTVVEMQIIDDQQIRLKFMIFLAFEQIRRNEK